MHKLEFQVKGMDCGEEIAVLKRELGPLVGGEEHLSFDLLQSKLTVQTADGEPSAERIRRTVANTGMQAVPWSQTCAAGVCSAEAGMWREHSRLVLCLVSGFLTLAALLLEIFYHGGLLTVATGFGAKETATSPDVIGVYLGAIVAGGWFVAPKAFFAAKRLRPDMNLLMVIAVIGAAVLHQWFEAACVTFLFSLALLLESWSVSRARRAIQTLVDIAPAKARIICPHDGEIEEKPSDQVRVGTTVLVRPGEKIPLDGILTKGETDIDQAPITGESMPVPKQPGDAVYAGTINGSGAFEFRSTKAVSDTTLARIIHMVEEAQSRRAPTEQWVESFAKYYTPAMILLAALIAAVPPLAFGSPWTIWFYQALVILVIACPCSLVISTPVTIVAGLTAAARNGVLIKGGAYLEAPSQLTALALDKTGTLTYGQPQVQQVFPTDKHTEEQLLSRAAALEAHSSHPLARAIVQRAESLGISYRRAEDFIHFPGEGAKGRINNKLYWLGSHRMLDRQKVESPELHAQASQLEDAGHSLVTMWCDDHVCGLISIADQIRKEASAALRSLKKLGIGKLVMITGDNQQTAREVAAASGVDEYRANLLPEDKVRAIRELRREHGSVAMVGDGINDAPAMAESTVGIAMGAMGTDAAIETADIALMSDDLSRLPWLVAHSRRTLKVIKENIGVSLGIKLIFITMAVLGMATLWEAIAADMGASLLVISNGLRLLRVRA